MLSSSPPAAAFDAYLAAVQQQFKQIAQTQRTPLETVAGWVAEAMAAGRYLFVFGTGHSHLLAEEVFYRAGGLARVIPILDEPLMLHQSAVASTELERQEGYAEKLLQRYPLASGDVLIVASNSGRNAVPIELAQLGRARGAKIVALTNRAQSQAWPSRHSSGLKLADVANAVIDNAAVEGDAVVSIPGLAQRVGPTSSLTGILILNLIVVSAVERMVACGMSPEVFVSSNAGGDRHNQSLIKQMRAVNPHL